MPTDIPIRYNSYSAWSAPAASNATAAAFAAAFPAAVYEPAAPAGFVYNATQVTFSAIAAGTTSKPGFQLVIDSTSGPTVQYHGLPAPAVMFLPEDGNAVKLGNGSMVATVGVWFAADAPQNVSAPGLHCCNVSVVLFRSDDDGLNWQYTSTIATPATFRAHGSDEGPNENGTLHVGCLLGWCIFVSKLRSRRDRDRRWWSCQCLRSGVLFVLVFFLNQRGSYS